MDKIEEILGFVEKAYKELKKEIIRVQWHKLEKALRENTKYNELTITELERLYFEDA